MRARIARKRRARALRARTLPCALRMARFSSLEARFSPLVALPSDRSTFLPRRFVPPLSNASTFQLTNIQKLLPFRRPLPPLSLQLIIKESVVFIIIAPTLPLPRARSDIHCIAVVYWHVTAHIEQRFEHDVTTSVAGGLVLLLTVVVLVLRTLRPLLPRLFINPRPLIPRNVIR